MSSDLQSICVIGFIISLYLIVLFKHTDTTNFPNAAINVLNKIRTLPVQSDMQACTPVLGRIVALHAVRRAGGGEVKNEVATSLVAGSKSLSSD